MSKIILCFLKTISSSSKEDSKTFLGQDFEKNETIYFCIAYFCITYTSVFCPTGQEQTRDDLQEMCDKTSGNIHETETLDTTHSQQHTTDHRLTGATNNQYEVDMLARDENEDEDAAHIKMKQEKDMSITEITQSSMNDHIIGYTITTNDDIICDTKLTTTVDTLARDKKEGPYNTEVNVKQEINMDTDGSSMNDHMIGYAITTNDDIICDTKLTTTVDTLARDNTEGPYNTEVNVKQEINIDTGGSCMNDDMICDTSNMNNDKTCDTNMKTRCKEIELAAFCSVEPTPATAVPTVTHIEDENIKTLENPTFASILAKPKLAEQSRFVLTLTAQPVQPVTSSSSNETTTIGVYCATCETMCPNQTHFKNHGINCSWVCKLCKLEFAFNHLKASQGYPYSVFKKKLDQHRKECDRTCKLCGISYRDPYKLRKHMSTRHSTDKKFSCDVCFFTFDSEDSVYTHKITNHRGENGIYRCPVCSKEFPWLNDVQRHLRKEHLFKNRHKIACSLCGKMCTAATIKKHEEIHKVKDIKCDQCSAMFKDHRHLRAHQRRHNKDYSHYCEICAKGFYTITCLEQHRRIHTGEKPFSCSLCEFTCNVKGNLDKHMKIHSKPSVNKK